MSPKAERSHLHMSGAQNQKQNTILILQSGCLCYVTVDTKDNILFFITFPEYPVNLSLTSSRSIFAILSSPVIICKDSGGPHEVFIVPMQAEI